MKNLIKNNLKMILSFLIGILVSGVGVYAANSIFAKDITYTNAVNNNVTNVKDALDDLYKKNKNYMMIANISGHSNKGSTFTNLDNSSISNYSIYNINDFVATNNSGIIKMKVSGNIRVCSIAKSHSASINTTKAKLYKNKTLIYEQIGNEINRCDDFIVSKDDEINFQVATTETHVEASVVMFFTNNN